MRSARMHQMRQGFAPAGRVRGALAIFYHLDDADALDRRYPLQLRGPRTAMRLREALLRFENFEIRFRRFHC